jgi:hypothetical protein
LVFPTLLTYGGFDWPPGTILSPGGLDPAIPATGSGNPGYATVSSLAALYANGSLNDFTAARHGLRIEIPRGSGMWYPVRWVSEDRDNSGALNGPEDINGNGVLDPILFLAKPIQNVAQYAGQPLDYRLEIGPTVLTDPDNHPLTRGVVIDLDASSLPLIWRPGIPAATSVTPYPAQMDIMFSPRGEFTGQLAATQGMLHFCVTTLEDAEKARSNNLPAVGNIHPVNITTSTTLPSNFLIYPYILADPTTPQRIVSVFLNSGRVGTSAVVIPNPGDPFADQPQNTRAGTGPDFRDATLTYGYALRGKEAK